MVVPPKKNKMMIFSRKSPMGLLGTTHHFTPPPYTKISPFVESIYCVEIIHFIFISFHSKCRNKTFLFSPLTLGKMIQFDDHIFQRGWFNHQPEKIFHPKSSPRPGLWIFGLRNQRRGSVQWMFFGRRWVGAWKNWDQKLVLVGWLVGWLVTVGWLVGWWRLVGWLVGDGGLVG